MLKKLLVLNASHSELPIFECLKHDYDVYLTGNDKNALLTNNTNYIPADFSDKKAILELAKHLGVSIVISNCNDIGLRTAAYVSEKLGLIGYDCVEKIDFLSNKYALRDSEYARFFYFPDVYYLLKSDNYISTSKINLPAVVKPVDSAGGKGVSICRKQDDIAKAIAIAFEFSESGQVIIEEYIEGIEISVSCLIQNGVVIFHYFDIEYSDHDTNTIIASRFDKQLKNIAMSCKQMLQEFAQQYKLVDGILHGQFIVRDNIPYLLEITRRHSGDLYAYEVQAVTGINWIANSLFVQFGLRSSFMNISDMNNFINCDHWLPFFRYCVTKKDPCIVNDFEIADELESSEFIVYPCVPKGYQHTGVVSKRLFVVHFISNNSSMLAYDLFRGGVSLGKIL